MALAKNNIAQKAELRLKQTVSCKNCSCVFGYHRSRSTQCSTEQFW